MPKLPKCQVFIDGSNVFHAQKKLGWIIDWKKVKNFIGEENETLEWRYYVSVKEGDLSMKGFLKYLEKTGIKVISKPLKKIKVQIVDAASGKEEEKWIYKGNFDVEIAADIILNSDNLDKVIIFSGDSDFNYLAKVLGSKHKKVEFYSSKKTVAWEIRKISGAKVHYFEDLKENIKSR